MRKSQSGNATHKLDKCFNIIRSLESVEERDLMENDFHIGIAVGDQSASQKG